MKFKVGDKVNINKKFYFENNLIDISGFITEINEDSAKIQTIPNKFDPWYHFSQLELDYRFLNFNIVKEYLEIKE